MPRRRRSSEQVGTAGFSPIDNPTDSPAVDLDPDPTTGRVRAQDEELEQGPRTKRRTRKGGTTTDRK
jgi:hypothetical protein